ncbi:acyclic terpene utilization AtuA family protein [Streptomyces sp. NPDC005438]|uniref:acyclic terpene utilization AtuA family protein n=1 Tax=Streptomyces sp. NPDC005438 TaxID=3156880 RepID=UPI00339F6772
MSVGARTDRLLVGNASGFYGDRFSAMREMLQGGELDVLTGDYLAELTLLILGRDRMADPERGYARTFLRQLEDCLGLAHERGVRLVANAGGLNPGRLARDVRELAGRLGLPTTVAWVDGDDLSDRDWGEGVLTANAYLGGAGITTALRAGADVVVTGRVTDAALVSGAAVAHFDWDRLDDPGARRDRLAGAVVAGHVLECGTQATGGNYSRFTELSQPLEHPGFPLAELYEDGTAVITKHPGTQGAVTVGTVTEQLLYETDGARYLGPDVTARIDTVRLEPWGPDRVRVRGVRGEEPPERLKVGLTRLGGYRNEVEFVLTGLDVEAKADLVRRQMETALAEAGPAHRAWTLARTDHPDAPVQQEAAAVLRLVVRDPDQRRVGRAVSSAAVELALGSVPGFQLTAPPGKGSPYGVFEAASVERDRVPHRVHLPDGTVHQVPHQPLPGDRPQPLEPDPPPRPLPAGPTHRAPLGRVVGARSGDKGGDANLGVWAPTEEGWRWLAHHLTTEELRRLLPEIGELTVERHPLPHLRAVNFVIRGLLGEGVASQSRFDPQAKALGEWLRSRVVDVPEVLL